jgi:hypothetical protein
MPDMKPLVPAPPLQDYEQHKERNAKLGCRYHERVQQDVAAGERIDPPCNCLIHRVVYSLSVDIDKVCSISSADGAA